MSARNERQQKSSGKDEEEDKRKLKLEEKWGREWRKPEEVRKAVIKASQLNQIRILALRRSLSSKWLPQSNSLMSVSTLLMH